MVRTILLVDGSDINSARHQHQHQHQHQLISRHSPKAFPTCQPQFTSLYLQYKSFPTPQSSNSAMVGIPGYTGGKIEFTS